MGPEWYEIQVKGQLGAGWSDWFDGMEVRALEDSGTLLRGPLADQAALHGVLARVYALNLTLLALRRVEPEATEASCRHSAATKAQRPARRSGHDAR